MALGINLQGTKEILGIWVEKTGGAKSRSQNYLSKKLKAMIELAR
ncbi:hypothetical protein LEP1GSC191_0939 [Leptospira borgpetersenii serovar Mini str. 201000851]|uniref:Uncharacterized protein n=2 Tax=Leptospira borgpetersenii TaxID=174 RepID=M3GV66_LEPBO|nr:hypothetical protein LEP1GSC128_0377 [Leptospira borgpetersenii str. 200801926]EMF98733.1 hypothetical protein LEP1GSC123_1343 [Leptospira borgpetersenii str. 200701203]ENO64417.1 hypothetical protein LEP1GSC191_0939 [Leptospira borgpetersenii serovar Mini str. 201000851]